MMAVQFQNHQNGGQPFRPVIQLGAGFQSQKNQSFQSFSQNNQNQQQISQHQDSVMQPNQKWINVFESFENQDLEIDKKGDQKINSKKEIVWTPKQREKSPTEKSRDLRREKQKSSLDLKRENLLKQKPVEMKRRNAKKLVSVGDDQYFKTGKGSGSKLIRYSDNNRDAKKSSGSDQDSKKSSDKGKDLRKTQDNNRDSKKFSDKGKDPKKTSDNDRGSNKFSEKERDSKTTSEKSRENKPPIKNNPDNKKSPEKGHESNNSQGKNRENRSESDKSESSKKSQHSYKYSRTQDSYKYHSKDYQNKQQLCMHYCKFGECRYHDEGTCRLRHDMSKVQICLKWLNGNCSDAKCKQQHEIIKDLVPLCLHFLQGKCSRENCPFLHIYLGANAKPCQDFLAGYCPKGSECNQLHLTKKQVEKYCLKDETNEKNSSQSGQAEPMEVDEQLFLPSFLK